MHKSRRRGKGETVPGHADFARRERPTKLPPRDRVGGAGHLLANGAVFRRLGVPPGQGAARVGGVQPRVLVVHHDSFGMRGDALVLATAIRQTFPAAEILSWELPLPIRRHEDEPRLAEIPTGLLPLLPFDLVFFMEHIRAVDRFWEPAFARRLVLVPNPEWLFPLDGELIKQRGIHAMLLKTAFAAQEASRMRLDRRIPDAAIVGWSSLDVAAGTPSATPSYDRALHIRGLATQKQTDMLLRTWHRQPHFPPLAAFCKSADGFALPATARIGGNISLFIGELEERAIRALQKAHGIHVYPSAVEGFGHALNEARAASAVLVTTGYPPMSDLVEDGVSGILIRTHEEDRFLFRTGSAIGVRETELAAAIERVLAMSIDERRAMGGAARAAFLAGQSAFHAALGAFVAERI